MFEEYNEEMAAFESSLSHLAESYYEEPEPYDYLAEVSADIRDYFNTCDLNWFEDERLYNECREYVMSNQTDAEQAMKGNEPYLNLIYRIDDLDLCEYQDLVHKPKAADAFIRETLFEQLYEEIMEEYLW